MIKKLLTVFLIFTLAPIYTIYNSAVASPIKKVGGTKCTKLGSKLNLDEKQYICSKAYKKFIWTKIPSNGDICFEQGKTIDNSYGYLECREVKDQQKQYFQLSNTFKDLPMQSSPLPFTICRVSDQQPSKERWSGATAFPVTWSALKNSGVGKVLFIPMDFSDFPGSIAPNNLFSNEIQKFKEWVNWYSSGKKSIQVVTYNKWIRASHESNYYADYLGHAKESNAQGIEMLMRDAENIFDYSNIEAVFFLFPPGLKTFPTETTRSANVSTNKGPMLIGIYATGQRLYNSRGELWFWLTHELLHAWGLQQHAPAYPSMLNISTGTPGPGQSLLSWDAITLDWSKSEELWCSDLAKLNSSDLTLVPMEREQKGLKAAMINLSPSRTLVIESHRRDKWGNFNKGTYGVTAYIVDTRFPTDRSGEYAGIDDFLGTKFTRAANNIKFDYNHGNYIAHWFDGETGIDYGLVPLFPLNYFLYLGESFTYDGVNVKLIKSGDNDTIRITKV